MKFTYRSQKQTHPDQDKHVHVNYAPSKRYFPRLRWYLILCLAASPLFYFIIQTFYNEFIITAPGFVSYQKIIIRTQTSAMVQEIPVKEGEQVQKGQVILTLTDPLLDLNIAQITHQLTQMRSLNQTTYQTVMSQLSQKKKIAEDELVFAQKQMAIIEAVKKEGEVGLTDYSNAEAFLSNAQYQLHDINMQIAQETQKNQVKPNTPQGYTNSEQYLTDQLYQFKLKKKLLTLYAPVNSILITRLVSPNEYVSTGEMLLILATEAKPYILTYLSPKYMDWAQKGETVDIRFVNGMHMKGTIMEKPKLTAKLPAELVDSLSPREVRILIKIMPVDAPKSLNNLDGIPATIYFSRF